MSPKVWLITGASTGLGRQLTEIVLENGDIAVATARRPEALSDLSSKYPSDRLLVLKLDVTIPQDIVGTFAAIKDKFGRLDVVFNNAGYVVVGPVELVNDEDARGVYETNFWGAVNVTREAVKFMRDVNPSGVGGRILQNSSVSGISGTIAAGFYSATKSALDGISEAFAAELDPTWNIRITIVHPGPFDTPVLTKVHWPPSHPAYEQPTSPIPTLRSFYEGWVPTGDPRKAMQAIYKLASVEDPPMHFPLGKSAVEIYKTKAAQLLEEAEKYASWSDDLDKATQ
ncbi:NAD(P)-binding protein [Daedaleopsis nitida]|nr:NAD(P)-binding protein [Daedaleopsis nitida]